MTWNSNKLWPLAIMPVIMYSSLKADSATTNDEQIAPASYRSDSAGLLAYGSVATNDKIPAKYQTPPTNTSNENQVFVSTVRTEVQDGVNLFVTADALYWTAREQMTGYVIESKDIDFTEGALAGIRTLGPHAKLKNFATEWNWGYRVGIGYNFMHDQWDLYFNWTHYQQNTTSRANVKNSEQQFFATWMQVSENAENAWSIFPQHAKGKWKLHYNTIDMEFGRTFGLGGHLIFRPHLGLRGAIINQDFDITYKNLLEIRGRTPFPKAKVDLDNDFWGVGLRGGVKAKWMFSRDWGVFGNFAGSLLWGRIENKTKLDQPEGGGIWIDEKHHRQTVKGNLEIALGLAWDYYFSTAQHPNRYHLGLTLAWEQLVWFHQNEIDYFPTHLITTHSFKQQGNLGLSGVTLGARFDF
ncbi:MAG: hypothetical protein JSS10_08960 [Verrucomicrobia bacterium]|nr:hypothetical protein [Verrucomicrobiota bacterium]